jgi:hypothetical protein
MVDAFTRLIPIVGGLWPNSLQSLDFHFICFPFQKKKITTLHPLTWTFLIVWLEHATNVVLLISGTIVLLRCLYVSCPLLFIIHSVVCGDGHWQSGCCCCCCVQLVFRVTGSYEAFLGWQWICQTVRRAATQFQSVNVWFVCGAIGADGGVSLVCKLRLAWRNWNTHKTRRKFRSMDPLTYRESILCLTAANL